jgi:preprotein translocase subunit SecE
VYAGGARRRRIGRVYQEVAMFGKAVKFFSEVKEETGKVVWPSKKETVNGSLMVFVFSVIFAAFFFVIDRFYIWLLSLIFNF